MAGENQIQLTGGFRAEEDRAAAALSPGHLLEFTSAGKVQKHSSEGDHAERAVAVEDALQGNTLTTAYALDDLVFYHLVDPGDEAQVFLQATENVAKGVKLISAGDGTLKDLANAATGAGTEVIAIARAALNLSATGAVDTLLQVRFV